MVEKSNQNLASSFENLFAYLAQIIRQRLAFEFNNETPKPIALTMETENSLLAKFIVKNKLSYEELIFLLLALVTLAGADL